MQRLNWDQYIIVTFNLLLGIFLNIFLFESLWVGLVFGLVYIGFFASCLGQLFFADKEQLFQLLLGGLFLLVLLILFGTAGYYLYGLDNWMICLVLMLVAWVVFIFRACRGDVMASVETRRRLVSTQGYFGFDLRKKIWIILYLILWLISILLLFNYQTAQSIRSPWEVVPKVFIVLYFVASLVLTAIVLRKNQDVPANTPARAGALPQENNKSNKLINLFLISLHFFLSLSVALIIYKIGYGFDGFVHRATEKVIYESGVIQPKPFYYIGQYSLVITLSKLLMIKLSIIDKILVPILACVFIPALTFFSLKPIFKNQKNLFLITNYQLPITGCLFFYSVPQGLANLLLLLLILLAIPYLIEKQVMPYFLWLLTLAVLIIHPLAGIPALIFVSTLYVLTKKQFKHPWLLSLYGLGAAVCIPVFFWLGSLFNSQLTIKFSASNLVYFKSIFTDFLNYLPFHSIYHLVYFYKFNILLLLIVVTLIGAIYLIKKKHSGIVLIYLLLTCLLLINLFLMGFFEFSSLINYEQGEFMKRLGQVIILFLVPMFLSGVCIISRKIFELPGYWKLEIGNWKFSVSGKFILILLTSAVLTMSLYLSYPHLDAFEKTRGFSVSQADIEAVCWIEKNAQGEDYVVLANQATSAAALHEFGFKKYYNIINSKQLTINKEMTVADLFYYPIPTSSPLYGVYLKMVYNQPKLEYIKKARDLTGASVVYFVINDYWLDAKKRIEQAKGIADEWRDVGDGRAWVFRFSIHK